MSTDDFNPIRITILKNGDTHFTGKKFVVTYKIYKNWANFTADVSKSLTLESGAVRRLFTINGSEIMGLRELQDSQVYVASSGDNFVACNYMLEKKANVVEKKVNNELDNTKSYFSPDSKGLKVYIYAEGKNQDDPKRLVLNYRNSKTFEQMLGYLSTELKWNEGTVKSVFDAKSFKPLLALDDFYDGITLIANGNPKISKPRNFEYKIVGTERPATASEKVTDKNASIAQEVKSVKEQIKKDNAFEYGGKGIKILAHLSGYDKETPKTLTLNHRNCKNMEQLYSNLSFALKPREGPVRAIFLLDLKTEITELSSLYEGLNVVCISKSLEKYPASGNYQNLSITRRESATQVKLFHLESTEINYSFP
eukprot:NODE_9_length_64580_cov_1.431941.p17 type:complete len:367 gc:universal NODE_9_length_64580_cov_1.431941:7885-6785(-)